MDPSSCKGQRTDSNSDEDEELEDGNEQMNDEEMNDEIKVEIVSAHDKSKLTDEDGWTVVPVRRR